MKNNTTLINLLARIKYTLQQQSKQKTLRIIDSMIEEYEEEDRIRTVDNSQDINN